VAGKKTFLARNPKLVSRSFLNECLLRPFHAKPCKSRQRMLPIDFRSPGSWLDVPTVAPRAVPTDVLCVKRSGWVFARTSFYFQQPSLALSLIFPTPLSLKQIPLANLQRSRLNWRSTPAQSQERPEEEMPKLERKYEPEIV
jgi:hypothetical protein